jgi:hypothetical protein
VPQIVVIKLDLNRGGFATVNNSGCAARNAETAARTRALLGALKSGKFHNILLLKVKVKNSRSTATSVILLV